MRADKIEIDRLIDGSLNKLCIGRSRENAARRVVFSGAFNPMHDGHRQMAEIAEKMQSVLVEYEISIVNVDKPLLSSDEIDSRLIQFQDDQTVWITRAATFVEKSSLFPGATFIVGADTIERIADSKYYGSAAKRDLAIEEITRAGCRFLVFGRKVKSTFMTLDAIDLPARLFDICANVPEKKFRSNLSSTCLRASQNGRH